MGVRPCAATAAASSLVSAASSKSCSPSAILWAFLLNGVVRGVLRDEEAVVFAATRAG